MTNDRYGARDVAARPGAVTSGPAVALDPRRWIVLVVVLVAGFMDLPEVTIVNVAGPAIRKDLRATYAQIEWNVNGSVLGSPRC